MEISDYIKASAYVDRMREIDKENIFNMLNNNILWDSHKQRISKGTYFVFTHNLRLYNILINEDNIKIDERTNIEEETLDRIFSFNTSSQDYHFFRCKHDKNGSSYLCRYYSKNGTQLPNLELKKEEFENDFNSIISNLESFDSMKQVYDIKSLKMLFKKI